MYVLKIKFLMVNFNFCDWTRILSLKWFSCEFDSDFFDLVLRLQVENCGYSSDMIIGFLCHKNKTSELMSLNRLM